MRLDTSHLEKSLDALAIAVDLLSRAESGSATYEVYRMAVVKGFELAVETSGDLIRKALREFGRGAASTANLTYKELLRQAAKRGLVPLDAVDRWFDYRDNRNTTAHDYGERFANETLRLVPGLIADARSLANELRKQLGSPDA